MPHSQDLIPQKVIELCNCFLTTKNQDSLDEIYDICHEQISSGNQSNIDKLISLTNDQNYEFILEILDEISTEQIVHKMDSDEVTSEHLSKMMVIPVKGIIGVNNKDTMLSSDDLSLITNSFRKNDLIKNDHDVILMPYLFSYENLPSTHVDAFNMQKDIIDQISNSNSSEKTHAINDFNRRIIESNTSFFVNKDTQSIRFILGMYVGKTDVIEHITELSGKDAFESNFMNWYNDVENVLSKYFQKYDDSSVSCTFPEDYFHTIKSSVLEHDMIGCLMSFSFALNASSNLKEGVKISLYLDEDSGCIYLYLMSGLRVLDFYSIVLPDCTSDIGEFFSREIINLSKFLEIPIEWTESPIKLDNLLN